MSLVSSTTFKSDRKGHISTFPLMKLVCNLLRIIPFLFVLNVIKVINVLIFQSLLYSGQNFPKYCCKLLVLPYYV